MQRNVAYCSATQQELLDILLDVVHTYESKLRSSTCFTIYKVNPT
eukprot:UN04318